MRRLLVLCLLFCLSAPTAAWGLRRAPGDGTLAVRNGTGELKLTLRGGAVIGKLEAGELIVAVPADAVLTAQETCDEVDVWGADREPPAIERDIGGEPWIVCRFSEFPLRGTPEATRFRLIVEDRMNVMIRRGEGFSLSAVARGSGSIQGAGGLLDGTYSVNGEDFTSLPDLGRRFVLRTATLH
jgi:hypothetical protein